MRAAPAAALLLAIVAAAGCAEEPEPAIVEADAITPGAWDVRGDTDYLLAWAHNLGPEQTTIAWSITSPGGLPLPDGWAVTFNPPTAGLAPLGTKQAGQRSIVYPDWAMTLMTLTLPEATPAGSVALELHAGPATRAINVTVHDARTHVSGPGSLATVQYEGRFTDTGETFDSGAFDTTLGRGETVPGFDYGLMGLAPGESRLLVIPPPFAYGYDPPPSHAKFAGKTLAFGVTITSLQG